MCRVPTYPIISDAKYNRYSAAGTESDGRLPICLKKRISSNHLNIELAETPVNREARGAFGAFVSETRRSNVHRGALLTNIRLSVVPVFDTRMFSRNSGSCRAIELCKPREERQPAITAHCGAVQALMDAGVGRALAGDAQLRSVGAQACTPCSRRHRPSHPRTKLRLTRFAVCLRRTAPLRKRSTRPGSIRALASVKSRPICSA